MTEKNLSLRFAESVTSYFRPGMMKWHYQDGLVVMSILKVAQTYERQDLLSWCTDMYKGVILPDGTIYSYEKGEYNLDQINAGRILPEIYRLSKDNRFLIAKKTLEDQLDKQPRTLNGIYWHKGIYPWQVWLDGLYMQGPFRTKCGHFDDVALQLEKVYATLKDEKTGLLYHAWDESRGQRWSDIETGLSPHFWSRSIGWYLMSCIDCLELSGDRSDHSLQLKKIIKELLGSVYEMRKDGMWYQVPDCPEEKGNYRETSATSMFCYSALKASHMGITSDYVSDAIDAMNTMCDNYVEEKDDIVHLGGICSVAGLGGNPYRDGSLKYYFCEPVVKDDFKGTGPFILACLELEKYFRNKKEL